MQRIKIYKLFFHTNPIGIDIVDESGTINVVRFPAT